MTSTTVVPLDEWIDRQKTLSGDITTKDVINILNLHDYSELRKMLSSGVVYVDPNSLDIYRRRRERIQRHA